MPDIADGSLRMKTKVEIKEIDKGWRKIKSELNKIDGSYVKVGLLGSAEDYEGRNSVAEVALTHEFGSGKIPERPFMRQALDSNIEKVHSFIYKLYRDQVLTLKTTVKEALEKIGIVHQGNIRRTLLRDGKFKALAESTIARRKAKVSTTQMKRSKWSGTERPLVDTGHLVDSVDYEVVKK